MGIITDFRRWAARSLDVTEAIGATVQDPDELLYRQIGTGTEQPNDNNPAFVTKQQRLARLTYFRSAVGGGAADAQVDRVIGAGVEFKAADPDVQELVNRFVNDPYNAIDQNAQVDALDLTLFGKLVIPIFLTKENADVRLGYVGSENVENIIWERGNAKRALAVVQRRPSASDPKYLWIVVHPDPKHDNRYPPHPLLTDEEEPFSVPDMHSNPVILPNDGTRVLPEIADLLAGEGSDILVAGYCFYHRANCLKTGDGHSVYERTQDLIKGLETWLPNTLRNAALQAAFIWDVTINDAGEPQIAKWLADPRNAVTPKPGSIRVHNQHEVWNAPAPKLGESAIFREILNGVLKLIAFASGLAGHEVGAEADVNRSTAKESRSTSINRAKRFQKSLAYMWGDWANYMVDQKQYVGQIPKEKQVEKEGEDGQKTVETVTVDTSVEVILPELDARDEGEVADSVKTMVEAMAEAMDAGLVLEKDAVTAVYTLIGQEPPSAEELQKEKERRRQEARDRMDAGMPEPDKSMRGLKKLIDGIGGNGNGKKANDLAGVGKD